LLENRVKGVSSPQEALNFLLVLTVNTISGIESCIEEELGRHLLG
jgi:hypothetical protein